MVKNEYYGCDSADSATAKITDIWHSDITPDWDKTVNIYFETLEQALWWLRSGFYEPNKMFEPTRHYYGLYVKDNGEWVVSDGLNSK